MKNYVTFLKQYEGFVPTVYKDVAGIDTIGIGTLWKAGMPTTITLAEAEAYCIKDCEKIVKAIDKLVTVPLNENQKVALVSFVYNLGISAFKSSTLLVMLNRGEYENAADQLLRWDKASVGGQKVSVKGLTNRRKAERDKFLEKKPMGTNV